MSHVWIHNPETGGDWQCPAEALEEYLARGWVETDAPPEPNPALAEQIAWRKQLAEEAAAENKATKAGKSQTTTTAAASGESQEG